MTIGLISDTHGLLRPEALTALQGVDHILHAGDIGKGEILSALAEIAPVTAVRGNVDKRPDVAALPLTEAIEFDGQFVYMIHILEDLDLEPAAAGMHVVIYGHSHIPSIHEKNGVLYVNPGSAGPRRFKLPVTVGRLEVKAGQVRAEIVELMRFD